MDPDAREMRGRELRGASWMIAGATGLAISMAIIKALAVDLPEPVIVLCRFGFALVFCGPALVAHGPGMLRTGRIGGHALRIGCGYAGFVCFVYASARMPLADAMALGFTQPLWAAVFAAAVFGERLGAVRVGALVVGFAGAMLVLRPGFGAAPPLPALAALANAVLTCVAMMTVKRLTATEPPARIALMFLLVSALLSVLPAAASWATPTLDLLPMLIATGAIAWFNQLALTRGYALGSFAVMAAMDFARLPAAVAIGWVLFGEAPDLAALVGIVLIGAASTAIVLGRPR